MRRPGPLRSALVLSALAGVALATQASGAPAPSPAPAPSLAPGVPAGAPLAAAKAEPRLPVPAGWPFAESFPRTSGTERLGAGASYWSDFLYDDHGANATGAGGQGSAVATLAPTDGTYTYPAGPASGNGADVFRNAVGLDAQASYWRVDWTTLVDPAVPLAVWALDVDGTSRGVATWPVAGLRTPGLDRALVVSSRGAWLLDARTGVRTDLSRGLTVDRTAKSFVVRVPRAVLPVSGTWRVRLASGLADAEGDGFAPATGAGPGGTPVYNVSYRSVKQEPQQYKHGTLPNRTGTTAATRASDMGNYWMEDHQAEALALGDVSAFGIDLRWSDLAARKATPEPLVLGYSNRWLVSALDLGAGVVEDEGGGAGDLRPNYLGRLQPYAVYVPTTYRAGTPTPLTWMLHSLSVNHNQYGALDPLQVLQTCEDRRSICATTLGRGPDMWYFDEAEVDFWEVWDRVARAFTLDPERTVLSGFSMGGYGSYKLGLAYPDLFAKAMALAGPPTCGIRVSGDVRTPGGEGRCTDEGDTTALVGNARNLQYVISSGVVDELVPYTSVLEQVAAFDRRGYRYHFESYPTEGHIGYAAKDAFEAPTQQLGRTAREIGTAQVDYTWYPRLTRPELGIGPTGVYWLRDLQARSSAPGSTARVQATSRALPDFTYEVVKGERMVVPGDPSPARVVDQTWQRTGVPARSNALSLQLTGVRSLVVDARRAGLSTAPAVALTMASDGPVTVRFTGLRAGAVVRTAGAAVTADRNGTAVLVR